MAVGKANTNRFRKFINKIGDLFIINKGKLNNQYMKMKLLIT